ncbi:acyl-CoA dehydrogenase family protein [Engelhardtia mirabilis]|uniref:Cyclohex-1-ene-1-carbonyl-CoA dehydrogenase n=1 Tax=Engelhardtia mirabilis TaxID=2528011 RepID=A0A518BHS0_9BACT|nr:Acyl-CoA dehydrogenase [Planctomycetes bacterium Pla133]QDV00858.1 Acyl-CoA dehydrogenase [Planctomycetes bacterium Pla86]
MDFDLNEDVQMVRDMTRDFADGDLIPRATQHDREGTISKEVFEKIAELGLWGLTIPEQFGGAGLGNEALTAALIELNRGCAATGVTLSVHNSLVGAPINKWGTDEQKAQWLPQLATGEIIGSYCLTEANAGSDAAAVQTSAVRDGDGWVMNGTKLWVTNGGWAGVFLVYARTNPDVSKAKGMSCFIVPKDTPGVRVGKTELKAGIRGSSTTEVVFENVKLPASAVLGEVDSGFKVAMDTLDGGRIGIASQAVGIGRACLEASIKYAGEREQFGRPIGHFQAIQWKIADMASRLDAAELLCFRAAWLRDRQRPCTREAAQAKLTASLAANFAADECLQIHGGFGYTDHSHVERLFRDARITEIYEGATDIQRLVIARNLMG